MAQMQTVFMDNWIKVSGEVLHDAEYFPPLVKRGETRAQMFISSPEGGSRSRWPSFTWPRPEARIAGVRLS